MRRQFFLVVFVFLGISNSLLHAVCSQPTIFDGIVKVNANKDGTVDYDAIRINKGGDLYQYISFIETTDLKTCSEAERAAFWINAYNAHLIRLVLARLHLASMDEDFALFGEKFKVANQKLSLNDIEMTVLRSSPKRGGPMAGVSIAKYDPRIHFLIVNGGLGSPPLQNRAITGANLEDKLQAAAINFANSPKYVHLEGDTLFVSSIFRWYADDFEALGGAGPYLASLIDPKLRPDAPQILEKIKTDFPGNTQFRFDWTLNKKK